MKKKTIISIFNRTYNIMMIISFIFFIVLDLILNKCSCQTKLVILRIIYAIGILYFADYKIRLCKDDEFYIKCYGRKAEPLNELPVNPCNVAIIGMLIYLFKPNRYLAILIFFCGLTGTPFALLFPQKGFYDVDLFKDTVFGYYLTHILCLFIPLFLLFQNFYYPSLNDILPAFIIFNIYSLICFLLNVCLHKSGKCTIANYAFNYDPFDVAFTKKLAEIAPNKFIFSLLMSNIFCLIVAVFILIFHIISLII